MDPLARADAQLTRAQARSGFVVTPHNAVSPMDESNTQQIPRSVVDSVDLTAIDPDATTRVTYDEIREHDETADPAETAASDQAEHDAHDAADAEDETVEVEEVDGLIPTTTTTTKSNLAKRLDG